MKLNNSKILYLVLVFFALNTNVLSQENYLFKGYVKGLTTMQSFSDGTMLIENTIHNRLDFSYYANDNLTFTAGMRNRVIAGNNVTLIPNYSDYLSRESSLMDLSLVWADKNSWVGISQFDRLNIDYVVGNFQVTLGRQRINWGQTFVWNPNDLFNTYSYFDFDYEEKPGSDALRLQYYVGESGKIESSTSINSNNKVTSALLYRFNTAGYDFQVLASYFTETDIVVGGGWSGSIGGGGFSGEFSYYNAIDKDSTSALTATVHYDYTFSSSLNIQFEALYNGFGAKDMSAGLGDVIFMDLSPKNLFPTQYAVFSSISYDVTPLFRAMLAGMYGPQGNFWYVGPTLMYSLSDTFELSAFGQYFAMDEIAPNIESEGTAVFVRLRWAF